MAHGCGLAGGRPGAATRRTHAWDGASATSHAMLWPCSDPALGSSLPELRRRFSHRTLTRKHGTQRINLNNVTNPSASPPARPQSVARARAGSDFASVAPPARPHCRRTLVIKQHTRTHLKGEGRSVGQARRDAAPKGRRQLEGGAIESAAHEGDMDAPHQDTLPRPLRPRRHNTITMAQLQRLCV